MTQLRPVWVEIDLDAVRDNVAAMREVAAPAALLAVVKADGYSHGAVEVAKAALDAGASWLGVALVEEGVALRDAGIEAPILVLSEPPAAAATSVLRHGLTPVVYTPNGVEALAKAVADAGRTEPLAVHVKVDTGMHRVGCSVEEAVPLVEAIAHRDELRLEGLCTHLAVADEPDNAYNDEQLDTFDGVLTALTERGLRPPLVHAANSAGVLAHGRAHADLVRVGIAVYGVPPTRALDGVAPLRPALSFRANVSYVKDLPPGARVSYGLRYELPHGGRVATVPVGYADGVPRNLGLTGGEVLIRGRRFPIAGTVTMDQLMVDVGDEPVEVGDDVVLLGTQGSETIDATEWADRLGTIAYEVVTGIGPRVPRRYVP